MCSVACTDGYIQALHHTVYACLCLCLCIHVCAFSLHMHTQREENKFQWNKKNALQTLYTGHTLCTVSNRKLTAVRCGGQHDLTRHDTEKSPGPSEDYLKTVPVKVIFFPKCNFSPPFYLLINARPLPCGPLCVFELMLTAISLWVSVSNALGPQSSYITTTQLGFKAVKAKQTNINGETVRGLFMNIFFLIIVPCSPRKNGYSKINCILSVQ